MADREPTRLMELMAIKEPTFFYGVGCGVVSYARCLPLDAGRY